jgi:hypothetical protein
LPEPGEVDGLSAEQWIDMDLGPVAGGLRPFPSEYGADLPEADGRGDKRSGIDRTPRWWRRDPERPTKCPPR